MFLNKENFKVAKDESRVSKMSSKELILLQKKFELLEGDLGTTKALEELKLLYTGLSKAYKTISKEHSIKEFGSIIPPKKLVAFATRVNVLISKGEDFKDISLLRGVCNIMWYWKNYQFKGETNYVIADRFIERYETKEEFKLLNQWDIVEFLENFENHILLKTGKEFQFNRGFINA